MKFSLDALYNWIICMNIFSRWSGSSAAGVEFGSYLTSLVRRYLTNCVCQFPADSQIAY